MLPETSNRRAISVGTLPGSPKEDIACGFPCSSRTKSSVVRSRTGLPRESDAETGTRTSLEVKRIASSSWGFCLGGFCAGGFCAGLGAEDGDCRAKTTSRTGGIRPAINIKSKAIGDSRTSLSPLCETLVVTQKANQDETGRERKFECLLATQ